MLAFLVIGGHALGFPVLHLLIHPDICVALANL